MTTLEKFSSGTISAEEQPYVDRLRAFIKDTADLNRLERLQENSDLDLYRCLLNVLDEINYEIMPLSNYTEFSNIPPNILTMGGTIQALISNGILSARNTLTYSDQGGVTVQDYDKYGRYLNFFNLFLNRYMRAVQSWKQYQNIEAVWGGVGSDYATINMWR